MAHTCNPGYSGDRDRRILVQGHLRQEHETLSEKQTKAKRAWYVAQMVQHEPSKHETLNSNSSTIKKKIVNSCFSLAGLSVKSPLLHPPNPKREVSFHSELSGKERMKEGKSAFQIA
jgi:hypothetical protein